MRLNEIITENHVRTKNDPYVAAEAAEYDSQWNPEAHHYASMERQRTEAMQKQADGGIPIILKDPKHEDEHDWTIDPESSEYQSPGFRGQQRTLQRVGAEYKPYQQYNPDFLKPDYPPMY